MAATDPERTSAEKALLRRFFSLVLLLVVSAPLLASDELIVVSGYSLKNRYSEIPPPCPEDHICMDSWFVHTVRVKDTLVGEEIRKKRIKAIHLQHGRYIDRSEELAVFILRRIEDADARKSFGADYQIIDFSWPYSLYCFDRPLSELGLDPDDPVASLYRKSCYEAVFEDE